MPDLRCFLIYCGRMINDRLTITQRVATQVLTIEAHPAPTFQIAFVKVQKLVIWIKRNRSWIIPVQYWRSIKALKVFDKLGSSGQAFIALVNAARLTHLEDEVASLSGFPIWCQGFVSSGTQNDASEDTPDFEEEIDEIDKPGVLSWSSFAEPGTREHVGAVGVAVEENRNPRMYAAYMDRIIEKRDDVQDHPIKASFQRVCQQRPS